MKSGRMKTTTMPILCSMVVVSLSLGIVYFYLETERLKRKISKTTSNETEESVEKSSESSTDSSKRDFSMHEIGVVYSPFPQRAGCPRQGTLAPHVASHVLLHSHLSADILDGITSYSHVWVIFSFHLNSRGKAKQGTRKGSKTFTAAKVRPPRAGGRKIGVLATRAPHRPNPVGLSLALLESVSVVSIRGKSHACLVLRGLDLVDNTPVYDIKPYVVWDSVERSTLRVPSWVSAEDEMAQVTWSEAARVNLAFAQRHLAPLYPKSDQGIADASKAISEIVAQDPRAPRDGRGASSVSSAFEFSFGELRVSFVVDERRVAKIISVIVDEGDLSATDGSYPRNLAVRRNAERKTTERGDRIPSWAGPVREGDMESLLQLQDGTVWQSRA